MSAGYTTEGREEFYASGAFEALGPFVRYLADLQKDVTESGAKITDELTEDQIEDFCFKASKIIGMLYIMVHDARVDIANLKEAANANKH